MRLPSILTSSAVLAALCTMLMGGCGGGGTPEEDGSNPALSGDELNGATAEDSTGKITLCHVPPGNPANAHTLVVGASAWNGHRHHRGDHLGACEGGGQPDAGVPPPGDGGTSEPPPPPPPPGPICAPEGAACGGTVGCCNGLECQNGYCQGIIG